MKTAAEYLTAAIRELRTSRADIDRQIQVLERTLSELSGGAAAQPIGEPRSIREIVLAMASEAPFVEVAQVVTTAKNEGSPAQYASISSILSRLVREGVLEKGPRRGTYQLPQQAEAHSEAEEPPPAATPISPLARVLGASRPAGSSFVSTTG